MYVHRYGDTNIYMCVLAVLIRRVSILCAIYTVQMISGGWQVGKMSAAVN